MIGVISVLFVLLVVVLLLLFFLVLVLVLVVMVSVAVMAAVAAVVARAGCGAYCSWSFPVQLTWLFGSAQVEMARSKWSQWGFWHSHQSCAGILKGQNSFWIVLETFKR